MGPANSFEMKSVKPNEKTGIHVLLEHVYGLDKVKAFLRSELLDQHKDEQEVDREMETFCTTNECRLWKVEPHLMVDLTNNHDENMRDRLRKFIYAVSWRSHGRPEPERLHKEEAYLNDFARNSSKAAESLEYRMRDEQAEARRLGENDEEDIQKAEAIRMAVENEKKIGAQLKEEVAAIEDFMNRAYERLGADLRQHGITWPIIATALPKGQDMEHVGEKALKEAILQKLHLPQETGQQLIVKKQILDDLIAIQHLRVLRDYLYFKYLYPNWMRIQEKAA